MAEKKLNWYAIPLFLVMLFTWAAFVGYVSFADEGSRHNWTVLVGIGWFAFLVVLGLFNLAECTNPDRIMDPEQWHSAWFALQLLCDWYVLDTFRNRRHAWRSWRHGYVY
jgi:hypothetical protein